MSRVNRILAALEREGIPAPINDKICSLVAGWEQTLPDANDPHDWRTCQCGKCRDYREFRRNYKDD